MKSINPSICLFVSVCAYFPLKQYVEILKVELQARVRSIKLSKKTFKFSFGLISVQILNSFAYSFEKLRYAHDIQRLQHTYP